MSQAVRTLTVAAVLAIASSAGADVQHVVARGHTLEAIAHRYHVDVKAIVAANKLKDPKHLKPGDTLIIPGVKPAAATTTSGPGGAKGKAAPAKPPVYAMRAKTPGVIHAARLATSEDFTVRVADRRGRVSPTTEKAVERMLRSVTGQTHPIEPRLIALLSTVSDHFGSRKIEVISGFRPYTPTQHTAHSNHNIGKAVDFRVTGVPNEVVRDYCRTLHNVGCGYYPNSTFVHMDVRTSNAFWIDYSKPGEAPRYNSPNVDADEGTSDVGEEMHSALGASGTTTAPATPPAAIGDDESSATGTPSAAPEPTVAPPPAGSQSALPTPLAAPAPSAAPAPTH